jgi:NitT/TauT family transport system substrate-binding protein
MKRSKAGAALCGAMLVAWVAASGAARAEVGEVKIARQFGIHYLPLVVMEDQKLVEKRARADGLGEVKVEWVQLSGGATVNDALLSHAVDFSAGGVGPLIVLWDKTHDTKSEVKGLAAVSDVPMTLTTRDPKVKTIADFTDQDRIALPAVKTSMQAVTLQMAAAKQWGDANFTKLDPLTVSMRHPDAAAAMISGFGNQITSHFTAAPYDFMELKNPAIHAVLDSYDVYGGPATLIVLYATRQFVDGNPKVARAVVEAMGDAMELIGKNHREAAEIYLRVTKEKTKLEDMVSMLDNPKIAFRLQPSNTYPVAVFLHRIGRIKTEPASWKDYFFPSAHALPGS